MLRTGLSFLKRSPGVYSLSGICAVESSRLLTLRRPEAFFLNQSVNYCDQIKVPERVPFKADAIVARYRNGLLKMPSPIEVTSLPPKPYIRGDEDFIAVDIVVLQQPDEGEYTFPFVLTAVSNKGQFRKICKPYTGAEVNRGLQHLCGVGYDKQYDVVRDQGEPAVTVQVSESLEGFLNFLNQHKNPAMLVYGTGVERNLFNCFVEYDKYNELIKACPLKVDVQFLLRKLLKRKKINLNIACEKLINFDTRAEYGISECRGILKLYTEQLLDHGGKQFPSYSTSYIDMQTYLEMLSNGEIEPIAALKLSQNGLRLEHLHYLKNQGPVNFSKVMLRKGLQQSDIDRLYINLTKENNNK